MAISVATVALALGMLATYAPPAQAQSVQYVAEGPDFAIPDGYFFTEALPDHTDGAGFAVQDGDSAQLWTAFQSSGGLDALGYPTSRRFELSGNVAQAFAKGVLRWNRATATTDILSVHDLPGGKVPAYATVPDQPPVVAYQVQPTAWSGWWWPAFNGVGPTLFAPDGPLDKYDQYTLALRGSDPGTRDWERQSVYFPNIPWAGHCNGFAAAALLEPEPLAPVTALGVTFSVADLKGLLVDYHFGDAAEWSYGDANAEVSPAKFHSTLLDWVASKHKGFVVTFEMGGGEVWSYPVYQFSSQWAPDAVEDGLWHVTTTVWMADMDVAPDFTGTQPYPGPDGKTFTYDLHGDPRHPDPGDGTWTGASASGRFAHPGRIWYPDAHVRNPDAGLVSPGLDRQVLSTLLS
ncbi:MAG: hypothetical protein JO057_09455 [Chloroflexi bacterium]|nr:hypothetical protein [Chloroflexota bacterium]